MKKKDSMSNKRTQTATSKLLFLILFYLSLVGCAHHQQSASNQQPESKLPPCYVMYDAGSTGTRLYIYQQDSGKWINHEGPKTGALADPIRGLNGKALKDVDGVTTDLVESAEKIKNNGPLGEDGKPIWDAFNWETKCGEKSVRVYATAGMRIAEQENKKESAKLWSQLGQKLQTYFTNSVDVEARTMSGYEEGLFAWLAVREEKNTDRFGIVEMGGASSQIAFPCSGCASTDDAVKTISIDKQPFKIFSYSFLGMGQNEAPKILGLAPTCAYGVKTVQPSWTVKLCEDTISITNGKGIRDPINFNSTARDSYKEIPTQLADVDNNWILTGSFQYHELPKNIDDCCKGKGTGTNCRHNQPFSCFRPIYFEKYLRALGVPTAPRNEATWTKGAAICESNNCLNASSATVCRWLEKGCI